MGKVRKLVVEHASFVHAITEELLKQGDLTGEEIDQIYNRLYEQNQVELPEEK